MGRAPGTPQVMLRYLMYSSQLLPRALEAADAASARAAEEEAAKVMLLLLLLLLVLLLLLLLLLLVFLLLLLLQAVAALFPKLLAVGSTGVDRRRASAVPCCRFRPVGLRPLAADGTPREAYYDIIYYVCMNVYIYIYTHMYICHSIMYILSHYSIVH